MIARKLFWEFLQNPNSTSKFPVDQVLSLNFCHLRWEGASQWETYEAHTDIDQRPRHMHFPHETKTQTDVSLAHTPFQYRFHTHPAFTRFLRTLRSLFSLRATFVRKVNETQKRNWKFQIMAISTSRTPTRETYLSLPMSEAHDTRHNAPATCTFRTKLHEYVAQLPTLCFIPVSTPAFYATYAHYAVGVCVFLPSCVLIPTSFQFVPTWVTF